MFRAAAATLIPVALVGMVEVALRLFGYGYPTTFFSTTEIGGQPAVVENAEFARRFLPLQMARTPSPIVFPARKPPNTYRIFVLGESAALGDPEPAFSFGRYLEVLLRERYRSTRFEVISAAVTALNSHALLPIARECAAREGDLWLIYMGNNEVVGPFGAGTVLGPRAPPLWVIRGSLALKCLRVGQLFDALIARFGKGSGVKSWEGMQMFLEARTRPEEPARRRTVEHFQRNLEDMLRVARKHDINVVLSTVASNLKDCAPFSSLHATTLNEAERSACEAFSQQGTELQAAGNWSGALEKFEAGSRIDDKFAQFHFQAGQCHLALTNSPQARQRFESARDLDALAFRAESQINSAIRLSAEHWKSGGVGFLDAETVLPTAALSPVCGDELFYEHVHFNFEGNYQLARAFAEEAIKLMPAAVKREDRGTWLNAEECHAQLVVTPWDRFRVYQNVQRREAQPPFTWQSNHAARVQAMATKISQLKPMMTRTAADEAAKLYRQRLAEQPNDFYLHGNLAKLFEDNGNFPAAVGQWEQLQKLLPYHFGPCYYLGKALGRVGRYEEAEQWLRRTLQLRPDAVEAMDELALQLIKRNKGSEAIPLLEAASRLQPRDARFYVHRAQALAALDRRAEALASLRHAVQLRPDYADARYLLGVELAIKEDNEEAARQFSEVLRLRPGHAPAHLNLGIVLARQKRLPEAIAQFQAALRLDPTNELAQSYLAKLQQASP